MKHMKKVFLFVISALVLLTAAVPDKTTTIFVIGDSTAANKDTTGGKQERGWAMMLQGSFDTDYIVVDNHAVNYRRQPPGRCPLRGDTRTETVSHSALTMSMSSLHRFSVIFILVPTAIKSSIVGCPVPLTDVACSPLYPSVHSVRS